MDPVTSSLISAVTGAAFKKFMTRAERTPLAARLRLKFPFLRPEEEPTDFDAIYVDVVAKFDQSGHEATAKLLATRTSKAAFKAIFYTDSAHMAIDTSEQVLALPGSSQDGAGSVADVEDAEDVEDLALDVATEVALRSELLLFSRLYLEEVNQRRTPESAMDAARLTAIQSMVRFLIELLSAPTPQDIFGHEARVITLDNYRTATRNEIKAYYEGAPLTWNVIRAGADVPRAVLDQWLDIYLQRDVEEQNRKHMLVFAGGWGEGKTTLAWRFAARLAEETEYLLLQLPPDTPVPQFWRGIEFAMSRWGQPIIVLVDNAFRDSTMFDLWNRYLDKDLPLTIIATSPTNELPTQTIYDCDVVPLEAPTAEEKLEIMRRLRDELGIRQQPNAQPDATSWLVMMSQLTQGAGFTDIVRNCVQNLSGAPDKRVYNAYKYLCMAGQYDVTVPTSLMERVGKQLGQDFFDLQEAPAGKGVIFHETRVTGVRETSFLRVQHRLFAEQALQQYSSSSSQRSLALQMIEAVDATNLSQRQFVLALLRALSGDAAKPVDVNQLMEDASECTTSIHENATSGELITSWAPLYQLIGDKEKVAELIALARQKPGEEPQDWHALFHLAEQDTSDAAFRQSLVNQAWDWLTNRRPDDTAVRAAFLGFVKRNAPDRVRDLISDTQNWLNKHPDDAQVRAPLLKAVGQEYSNEKQRLNQLAEDTELWLAHHESDTTVRHAYIFYLSKYYPGRAPAFIDATAGWLAGHPEDNFVRAAYLALVHRSGRPEQVERAIKDTRIWLAGNPSASAIRTLLDQLEKKSNGNQPAAWADIVEPLVVTLCAKPQTVGTRWRDLILVETHGTRAQRARLLTSIRDWLENHRENTFVRGTFVGLAQRWTDAQDTQFTPAVLDETSNWLADHLDDTEVMKAYLLLLGARGTVPQMKRALEDIASVNRKLSASARRAFEAMRERYARMERDASIHAAQPASGQVEQIAEQAAIRELEQATTGSSVELAESLDRVVARLTLNASEINLLEAYLGVIRQYGGDQVIHVGGTGHIETAIESTASWLADNVVRRWQAEQRLPVEWTSYRAASSTGGTRPDVVTGIMTTYLALVVAWGSAAQVATACGLGRAWLKQHPNAGRAQLLREFGRALAKHGQFSEARNVFQHALSFRPSYVQARIGLAWALYESGQAPQALAALKQALSDAEAQPAKAHSSGAEQHDRQVAGCLRELGNYCEREHNLPLALDYFGQAIATYPKDPGAYWARARIYQAQKNDELALWDMQSARIRLPAYAKPETRFDLHLQRAALLTRLERYQEARAEIEEARRFLALISDETRSDELRQAGQRLPATE